LSATRRLGHRDRRRHGDGRGGQSDADTFRATPLYTVILNVVVAIVLIPLFNVISAQPTRF
jgi:hypothetical protein